MMFHASCGSLQLAQHGFSALQLIAMWPSCPHLPHLSGAMQGAELFIVDVSQQD
jgi:hypothetical protein